MALARVVAFEGVGNERIEELRRGIEQGEQPEGLRATEFMLLHEPGSDNALAIVFFDNEDDYRDGDAVLSAMPAGDTPGRRVSVKKYEVVIRATV